MEISKDALFGSNKTSVREEDDDSGRSNELLP